MKAVLLTGAISTEAGKFRDAGSVVTVGDGAEISTSRAKALIAEGRAVDHDPKRPDQVKAA
jgi:hypothetical protein